MVLKGIKKKKQRKKIKKNERTKRKEIKKEKTQQEKKLFPLGLEPRTFRVLGGCDDHYTTETPDRRGPK